MHWPLILFKQKGSRQLTALCFHAQHEITVALLRFSIWGSSDAPSLVTLSSADRLTDRTGPGSTRAARSTRSRRRSISPSS
jgi:hypothetical protein